MGLRGDQSVCVCVCVCAGESVYVSPAGDTRERESKRQRTQSSGAQASCARRANNAAKRLEVPGEGTGVQLARSSIPQTWAGVRGSGEDGRAAGPSADYPTQATSGVFPRGTASKLQKFSRARGWGLGR